MQFREYLEMASFTLPHKLKIGHNIVSAVDMQFEKAPATVDSTGHVMNQGSKFIAKVPRSSDYISYDGQGSSEFVKKDNLLDYIRDGYHKIPDNWWKKAKIQFYRKCRSSLMQCYKLSKAEYNCMCFLRA